MGLTWTQRVELADEHKAVGWDDIILFDGDFRTWPWEHATEVSKFGSVGYYPSSVQVKAEHPSGMKFSWTVDILERTDNGYGYHTANGVIREIMGLLPTWETKQEFRQLLGEIATAMYKRAQDASNDAARFKHDGDTILAVMQVETEP